jgi:hypothetical protein
VIVDSYHRGVAAPGTERARRGERQSAALRRDEIVVLQFLHDELDRDD